MAESGFKPSFSLFDATMLVAGSMIGSGIFIVSADMLRNLGSAGWLLAAWAITGIMTLFAALSYGELAAMFPNAGGQYVYLRECYGRFVAFLYGWAFFSVIQTGTIAAVGVAFSKFAAYIFPFCSEENIIWKFQINADPINPSYFSLGADKILSVVLIIFLTYINSRGAKTGKWLQNIFTASKLAALFGIIIIGFAFSFHSHTVNNWLNPWQALNVEILKSADGSVRTLFTPINGLALLSGLAAAMVGSIFSSDAWNNITFIATEIKNPTKNIGLSLLFGTCIVTVIYLAANTMYLSVLGIEEIVAADKDRVAVVAMQKVMGHSGTIAMALLIMVSTFGCNNGLILSGARVYYSMALDGLFFKKAALLNKENVPSFALWAQCLMASALCVSGKYGSLLDMISFVVVFFYILTILGLLVLRTRKPNLPRPYKVVGYPVIPILYILAGIAFCLLLLIYKPQFTWPGIFLTALGIPIYYLNNKKKVIGDA